MLSTQPAVANELGTCSCDKWEDPKAISEMVGLVVGLWSLKSKKTLRMMKGCTYIHTYIQTYIHTYINTYINTYIYKYIYIYTHTYIHACMHTYRGTGNDRAYFRFWTLGYLQDDPSRADHRFLDELMIIWDHPIGGTQKQRIYPCELLLKVNWNQAQM